jgi:hypothetical protein
MNSGGGKVDYLRGVAYPGKNGFLDNVQNGSNLKYLMDICSTAKFGLLNGYRDMYQEVDYDEFKKNGNSYTTRQEVLYNTMRTYAKSKGFVQICQIAGHNTASGFGTDPAYSKVGTAGYFPLPTPGNNTTLLQSAFSEWALQSDKLLAVQSIWLGAQEPTHTLGFSNGSNDVEGNKTNIRRFVNYWKPIADKIKAGGSKVGGIQLNSGNVALYDYGAQVMKDNNLNVDYLTFQLYKWGDVRDMNAAVSALNSYQQKYPYAKIIVNRGNWSKIVPGNADALNSSTGVITFLTGEKVLVDNPGKFFGYTLDIAANSANDKTIWYKTVQWLNNNLYSTQRILIGLPGGVNGFITSEGSSKISAVLWNTSDNTSTFSLKIIDGTIAPNAAIKAYISSGASFTGTTLRWNGDAKQIEDIRLGKNEFILLQLN